MEDVKKLHEAIKGIDVKHNEIIERIESIEVHLDRLASAMTVCNLKQDMVEEAEVKETPPIEPGCFVVDITGGFMRKVIEPGHVTTLDPYKRWIVKRIVDGHNSEFSENQLEYLANEDGKLHG